jgi:hypothetical protein
VRLDEGKIRDLCRGEERRKSEGPFLADIHIRVAQSRPTGVVFSGDRRMIRSQMGRETKHHSTRVSCLPKKSGTRG